MRIILASTSSIRREILTSAGLSFTVQEPQVDERLLEFTNQGWTPQQIPIQLARHKASSVSAHNRDALVIGADQTLIFQDQTVHKPSSIEQAREQLMAMRGRAHKLVSAVCCVKDMRTVWNYCNSATLQMRSFSEASLDKYLQTAGKDVMTSVGGYKIETSAIQLFESIRGDYFTVLGLPLLPLLKALRKQGALIE
ncbi:MAG: septum formation protein Maf [Alphaproteobacteria bacterium]|nr:septum formation protein Maf [Alphaproteobacteria bacterium]